MINKILLALILFVTQNTYASPTGSGNISSTVNIGGMSATTSDSITIPLKNPDDVITLNSDRAAITAAHFNPFMKNGALYQVPSGKTFNVYKFCVDDAAGANAMQLVSATATFAVNAASITGGVYQSTSAGAYSFITIGTAWFCYDISYQFAQNTWPGFQGAAAVGYNVMVSGVEK